MPFSTITVLQPDFTKLTDVNATLYGAVAGVSATSGQSAAGFTGYANGFAVDFTGTGLTYDEGTGALTGGTLTSFTLRNHDGRVTVMSFEPGLDAATVMNASANQIADIFKGYSASFQGLDGEERFSGGDLDDALLGGKGADVLLGGAGNDTIDGGAGADIMSAGDGIDTVSYASSANKVDVSLFITGAQVDADGDQILDFENLIGSDFNDSLHGDDAANVIDGGKGDDTLIGNGGDDTVFGGDGNDRVYSSLGVDSFDGGAGIDTLDYSQNDTRVTVILGDAGVQTTVIGSSAGSPADGDKIRNFEDVIGTFGNDILTGNTEANRFTGFGGHDTIRGGAGNDYIDGGTENDFIEGGAGADQLDGSVGIDTLSYAGSLQGVTIDYSNPIMKGGDAEGDVIVGGFEIIVGSDKGDVLRPFYVGSNKSAVVYGAGGNDVLLGNSISTEDTLDGGLGDDVISGFAGKDAIDGGLDDDTIEGGADADLLDGSSGRDTLSYFTAKDGVTVELKNMGAADVTGNTGNDAEGDVATGFENLLGGKGNDTLIGDKGNNVIEGSAGEDELDGGGGVDTLSYAHSSQGVMVNLSFGLHSGGDAEGDQTKGFENLIGSSKSDFLTGTALANRIEAGAGDDEIMADLGADSYDGGAGNDIINYGALSATQAITVTLGAAGVETAIVAKAGSIAAGDKIKNFEHVIGGSGNDVLIGNAEDNVLEGLDGDDIIIGGAGKDTISGGSDDVLGDTVTYASSTLGVTVDLGMGGAQIAQAGDASGDRLDGFEHLIGTAKNDILVGTADTNNILGGAGDDVIDGRGMNAADPYELLDGGVGNDTVSYQSSTAGVTVDLSLQGTKTLQNGGDAKGDKLVGIENLVGSNASDWLTGDKGNNVIEGGVLGDLLHGGKGFDTLSYAGSTASVEVRIGDDGKITVATNGDATGDSGDGFENITGSAKGDQLVGNKLANVIIGNAGDDLIAGMGGKDIIRGGDGNDTLVGGNNAETIDGGAGNDIVGGSGGADVMDGGTGIDLLSYEIAASASVTVVLGEANKQTTATGTAGSHPAGDKIMNFENVFGMGNGKFTLSGNSLANILQGANGNDSLKGLGGDDDLFGANGDDLIEGGAGNDTLTGGFGDGDTLSYAGSAAGVFVNLESDATSSGDAQGDAISGFENLVGSAKGDYLEGSAGKNVIAGGLGDDTINGRGEADKLDGGVGIDEVSYAFSAAGVTVDLTLQASKTAQAGAGDAKGDILTGFEQIRGSSSDDRLTGDAGNNDIGGGSGNDVINGGKGNDNLAGSSGNDVIDGGDGNDIIEGGNGNDKMNGGKGIDTLSYADAQADVIAVLDLAGSGGHAEGDENTGFENVFGGFGNDTLGGNDLANAISGADGNDRIRGDKGADVLDGGAGIDTLIYNTTAAETITVTLGEAGVQTTVVGTAGSIAAGDKIKNFEDITGSGGGKYVLTGNSQANSFDIGGANDVLKGLGGDDYLDGNLGDDWIEGGEGADQLFGGNNTAAGDTLSYQASAQGVTIDLAFEEASGGDARGDTFSGFENVFGSDKDDVLLADFGSNKIEGAGGNDFIRGGHDADVLIGGTGVNTLSYESTGDGITIPFVSVTVTLVAGKQAIVSGGDAEGDIVTGFQNLIGSSTDDKLTGDTGNNVIEGGAGADIMVGGGGIDTLSYVHDTKGVTVLLTNTTGRGGEAEGDKFTGFTNLIGGSGNDILGASASNALIVGGAGDDQLFSGNSATLDGGTGMDRAYSSTVAATGINLAAGTMKFGAVSQTLLSVELIYGGIEADFFSAVGFGAASKNAGSTGIANRTGTFNQFEGWRGDDKIVGNGHTQISYEHAEAAVTVDLKAGSAQGDISVGKDSILGGVNSVRGSAFDDKLFGSDNLDTESFQGLAGNDTIDGNGGFDVADYSPTTGSGISVTLAGGTVTAISGADSGSDSLQQVEGVRGTEFDDTFNAKGFGSSNTNAGDFGSYNEFEGGDGNDTITGNGNTAIVFDHANAGVTVDLTAGKVTASGTNNVGEDSITSGVTRVRGSDFNDTITGADGVADVLEGGLGNDILAGGVGGNDTFVYSIGLSGPVIGGGADTILDWVAGRKIDLGGVSSVHDFDDVLAKMTQVGSNVLIDFGDANTLMIANVTTHGLLIHSEDFLFE